MEDLIITRDLLIMRVDSDVPTFESSRGRSWIDLRLCNSTLAQKMRLNVRGVSKLRRPQYYIFPNWFTGKWQMDKTKHCETLQYESWKMGKLHTQLGKKLKREVRLPGRNDRLDCKRQQNKPEDQTAPRYWPSNTKIYFSNNGCLRYNLPGNQIWQPSWEETKSSLVD